jgi:hypothetical protein
MYKITVYAGKSNSDARPPSIHDWSDEEGPVEALRKIGLEYKGADYFHSRQVVIVIDPVQPSDEDKLERLKQDIKELLDD